MAEQVWVMVRLRRRTHQRLMAERDSLEQARQSGQVEIPGAASELALSDLVDRMLDDRAKHRARRRRSDAKRLEALWETTYELA